MRKLVVFNNVTLDGYFSGPGGDLSWSHRQDEDPEWNAFVADNAGSGGVLLLGRITYELMASWWPTAAASKAFPDVARGMNSLTKVVFSRTLARADWSNTQLKKGNLVEEVRAMKQEPGEDMVILGSGSIVSQLAPEGLIDEYQVVVNPVVLGKGRTMFDAIPAKLALKLTRSRTFANGNVLLCYEPSA